jgi:hypothetical protein
MKVVNVHERTFDASAEKLGRLIDGLASTGDALWPVDRWPAMQFDRPLEVGAAGGHGPIRYVVESYAPGRRIQFRFAEPKGFAGVHRFEIEPAGAGRATLRHVIDMRVAGLTWLVWTIAVRPLHDALMEDALDRAEGVVGGCPPRREWSAWVRFVRWAMRRRRAARR